MKTTAAPTLRIEAVGGGEITLHDGGQVRGRGRGEGGGGGGIHDIGGAPLDYLIFAAPPNAVFFASLILLVIVEFPRWSCVTSAISPPSRRTVPSIGPPSIFI